MFKKFYEYLMDRIIGILLIKELEFELNKRDKDEMYFAIRVYVGSYINDYIKNHNNIIWIKYGWRMLSVTYDNQNNGGVLFREDCYAYPDKSDKVCKAFSWIIKNTI